jgi:hypothetical protein
MDIVVIFTPEERDRYTYFLGQALACGHRGEGGGYGSLAWENEYRRDALALAQKINGKEQQR